MMHIFNRILDIGRILGMGMIIFSMLAICVHVAMRYIFNYPINWVIDVSTIFIFLMTFLGSAWLLREEGHVSLDLLLSHITSRNWVLIQFINSLLCAAVCAVITGYGVVETVSIWKLDIYMDMPLAPPKWPIIIIVPLGCFLLFIQFLRRALGYLEKARSGDKE